MNRLWSRFCNTLARWRKTRGAVSASSSSGPQRPSGLSSAQPARLPRAGSQQGVSRQGCSTMVRNGARLGPAAHPGTFSGVPVATCAGHATQHAQLEGKALMSEPVIGGAGTARPDPADYGRDADHMPAMEDPPSGWPAGPPDDDALDGDAADADVAVGASDGAVAAKVSRRRRRGSRGGRGRHPAPVAVNGSGDIERSGSDDEEPGGDNSGEVPEPPLSLSDEAPEVPLVVGEGATATARPPTKPKIGDTRPGSPPVPKRRVRKEAGAASAVGPKAPSADGAQEDVPGTVQEEAGGPVRGAKARRSRRRKGEASDGPGPRWDRPRREGPGARRPGAADRTGGAAVASTTGAVLSTRATAAGRAARGGSVPAGDRSPDGTNRRNLTERRNRPLGRYLMVVHVGPTATQIAVLEGRTLIEHYVSRPADDATQIDGNIYLGRVQNVLPGMEAAFVDIGTPKNAVLYRGDLRYDDDEVERPLADEGPRPTRGRLAGAASDARIEQLLRTGQSIICQVTKNPIGTKGARLTQEVSLPGRFVVLIPDSETYGISKRLGDEERRRLRKILDDVRPAGHGLIVRTAAEGASADELGRDVARLMRQWDRVQELASVSRAPQLLYREPDLAVRVIREEFNRDYRGVVIDDHRLYDEVKEYVTSITPELAERVEFESPDEGPLPLFERFRVHEQVHKALDRKVWLPSGGSIILERTEALTVIDVNTGKNVGTSNLEETVFRNNLEAAEEIARQLRLRDIGGIIVIDFIDMDVATNRADVIRTFRESLARDKTRSQVFDISELGLVEMTRKRISEGLVESYSETCPTCGGRGIVFDESLL